MIQIRLLLSSEPSMLQTSRMTSALEKLASIKQGGKQRGKQRGNQPGATLLAASASLLLFHFNSSAEAAERAVLQYADRQVTVSLTELKTFADRGEASPPLREFIQQTPPNEEFQRQLLTRSLPVRFAPSGDRELSRNAQFILYQINKLVGSTSSQPNYEGLRSALFKASQNEQNFTILGVMDAYPEETVRVDLRQLDQVYGDVSLFLERLQPLFQSRQLINDWLCECDPIAGQAQPTACNLTPPIQPSAATPTMRSAATLLVALQLAAQSSSTRWAAATELPAGLPAGKSPIAQALVASGTGLAASPSKRLVVTFGPLGRSIPIADLTEFAATGQQSRQLRLYLRLANVEPADFQTALNRQIKISFRTLDTALSSIVGEYVLFRVGDVVHTQSEAGNIPALRSALVLSARDGTISPIEVLQHYPTPEIYLDGLALLQASRLINRTLNQDFGQVTGRVGDWLENLQSAIAAEVCRCNTSETPTENPLNTSERQP